MNQKKKTSFITLRLEKYAAEGKSVGRLEDGKTILVTGAVPGDLVQVRVVKNKSQYAEGIATEILEPSPDRIQPFCEHFGVCGGCKWQMLPYNQQLIYKQSQVEEQLTRIARVELPEILPIVGCDQDRYYRNKLEFTFSALEYIPQSKIAAQEGSFDSDRQVLGFHAPGLFYKVVDIYNCHLMNEPVNKIRNLVREFTLDNDYSYYNFLTQKGWLRQLTVRQSSLGQTMVNLVVSTPEDALFSILDLLKEKVPEISTLVYTINDKKNDSIYDLPVECYSGAGYIEERLGNYIFRISPKSFFQTNTSQAIKLYDIVKSFAKLSGTEILYDLYCGTGSIGIYLSDSAKKVIGIETVPEAVSDAESNAAINHITNCKFFDGDVIKILNDDFIAEHGRPDIIITDPPRAGMHPKLIDKLIEVLPEKIIYVSCNPATQARDIGLLNDKFKVVMVQPVDMFPQTHHIECVVLLEKRTN